MLSISISSRNIARLPNVDSRLLQSAMVVLQLLLTSSKMILRFGAIRALDSIANKDPTIVAVCNPELESLASDSNQAISTAAITTLLRTGSEATVDNLMRKISSLFAGLQVHIYIRFKRFPNSI
jgi:coatomer subunit gamma